MRVILPGALWQAVHVNAPGNESIVGGWAIGGTCKSARPEYQAMFIDEGNYRFNGRLSSAWATNPDAMRKTSFA